MADNSNPYTSQLTPITGIPERVGLPVDAIKEVGANLTQRYYAAKENVSKLNSVVANWPMFDKTVDSKIVQAAGQYVDQSFKKITENDDWYNATDTIMDVSNKLNNDPNLKMLANNVAVMQQEKAELDKRYEKEPDLRQYESWVNAKNMTAYRQQGGSMTKDGKPQSFTPFSPTTGMTMAPFIKHIEDVTSKMKAFKNAVIQNPGTFNMAGINQLQDSTVRGYFKKMYEDKISVASLTTDRLQEAAKQIIMNDDSYKKTNLEIQQAEHFLQTGKLQPDKEDLSTLYKNNSPYEKNLALQLSSTYQSELSKIQNDYLVAVNNANGNKNLIKQANAISQQKMNALNNNPNVYNEGHDKLLNLIEPEITNLYYGIKTNAVTNQIIKAGNAFAYHEKDVDRTIIDTGKLTDALLKQKEGNLVVPNAIGTNPVNVNLNAINPVSQAEFDKTEAAYNAALHSKAGVSHDLDLQYKSMVAAKKMADQAIISNYNTLSPEEQNSVLNTANPYISRVFNSSADARYALFNKTKQPTIQELNKGVSNGWQGLLPTTANLLRGTALGSLLPSPKGGKALTVAKSKYIFSQMHPTQILGNDPDAVLNSYAAKGLNLSAQDRSYFKQQWNTAKYDIGMALQNHKGSQLQVTSRDIISVGDKTPVDKAIDLNIGSSLYNGNIVDISGKAWTKEELAKPVKADTGEEGYIDYKLGNGKSLNTTDVNDLGEFRTNEVNTGGSVIDSRSIRKIHLPVRNKKNQIVGYKDIIAPWEGNNELVRAQQVQNINNTITHFNKPGTGIASQDAALVQMNAIGQTIKDVNGIPIQQHINEWRNGMEGTKVLQLNSTNSLNIHANKDKNNKILNYTVTPHLYNGKTVQQYKSFIVDGIDDIPTYIGGNEAIKYGANQEGLKPLLYRLTNQ